MSIPICSAVENQLRDRPTPSWAARTTRPRAHTIMLPLRTADRVTAGSILMRPTLFIHFTVSCELSTRTRDSTGSVRPLVTRIRSP